MTQIIRLTHPGPPTLLLTVWLTFFSCTIAIAAAADQSSAPTASSSQPPSQPLCQPLSSDFDFPKVPPHPSAELTFCKEYKSGTCCDKSSTMNVLRQLSPLFTPDSEVSATFSERCKQLTSTIACAPCHPDVGTRRLIGVCPQMCSDWFSACYDGLYTEIDGQLRPCTDASLICAPLHEIVKSGHEFCDRTGVGAGSLTARGRLSSSAKHGLKDDVDALVRRAARDQTRAAAASSATTIPSDSESEEELDEDDMVACFDGSMPSGRSVRSTSTSSSSTPSNSGSSDSSDPPRKRYYKSAEEVAELERKRQSRTAAADAKAFEQHGVVQVWRAVERAIREVMDPINRNWRKLVRRIPYLPRSVQQILVGPFGLSLVLFVLNFVIFSMWKRLIRRLCPKRSRTYGNGTTGSSTDSSSGLSTEEIRQLRAQKLMAQQYTQTKTNQSVTGGAQPTGTYTTVIDGELVTLPE